MNTQASLNNIFYYGLFTLVAIFTVVQGMAGQINTLFKPDVQTLELDTSRFYALTHSLFIILAFVIPAISFIFITKWMSNARSIAVKGAYLTEVESELNRAFARVKTFETLMKQSTNRTSGSETTESSTTRRVDSTGNLFNGYELNIGWETTLRRTRKSTGQTQLIFGGYHIFIIMGFFGSIALFSEISVLFLFGMNWISRISYILSLIVALAGSALVVLQFINIERWLKAFHFEVSHNEAKVFTRKSIHKKLKDVIDKYPLASLIAVLIFVFILLFQFFSQQEVSVFAEDKMIVAKQEIIASIYSQKIDTVFEEKGNIEPNDYQKGLAIEALDKLNQIYQNSEQDSKQVKYSKDSEQITEFIKYLKARRMNDLSGVKRPGADLRGVNLSGFILSGADLKEANLTGADLTGATLNNADLSGADLTKVKGVDCKKLNTEKVTLDGKTTLRDGITKGPCPLAKTLDLSCQGAEIQNLVYPLGKAPSVFLGAS